MCQMYWCINGGGLCLGWCSDIGICSRVERRNGSGVLRSTDHCAPRYGFGAGLLTAFIGITSTDNCIVANANGFNHTPHPHGPRFAWASRKVTKLEARYVILGLRWLRRTSTWMRFQLSGEIVRQSRAIGGCSGTPRSQGAVKIVPGGLIIFLW